MPMQHWDPMLAGYMQQRDYNAQVDAGAMAQQMYVEDHNADLSRPCALRLSTNKYQPGNAAAVAAATDETDWPVYRALVDFPAALSQKYEAKEQIGRHGNSTLSEMFCSHVFRPLTRAVRLSCPLIPFSRPYVPLFTPLYAHLSSQRGFRNCFSC